MAVELIPSRSTRNGFDLSLIDRALYAAIRHKGSFSNVLRALRNAVINHNIRYSNLRTTRYRILKKNDGQCEKALVMAVRPTEKVIILTLQSTPNGNITQNTDSTDTGDFKSQH